MNRGIAVLVGAVALAVLTAVIFCLAPRHAAPADWLRREFGLDAREAEQVSMMQADYEAHCAEMCVRIRETDSRLARLIQANRSITPEIRGAIVESDAVRSECRTSMLAHFYAVADVLPADKRERYLKMVVPAVLDPENMSVRRTTP
ncbi:MAG: hypothetical protein PHC88_04505 [Terrimicrobiaceae bacterium]|nr:hypothetical protein [Terrimicrobiaceae bacterium]